MIIKLKSKIKDKSNRIFYDEVQDTCFNELGIKGYNNVSYVLNLIFNLIKAQKLNFEIGPLT